ncbi:(2Fe-2S)-binding protein [Pseudaminobacter arsenicus]|uniref:(2Fe-2S)-binding protein n=1 Tax=Borborobacter arsenicus TaxID=1851146 RepID=A0A432V0U3_9HYPH|nr:(2Fe-2S)-binding protein [Pseudaminobacter arsenicus]RUM95817.1 (2Fe-2S)-binding protein [Pseudaminobacter arsenicus]
MFRLLEATGRPMTAIKVDGRTVQAEIGANLASVLLRAGFQPFRTTPVSGEPRMPYCMMGVCFECLATIDGITNCQTCLETVREGMVIERQLGASPIKPAGEGAP